jgi:hypothetical protein
MPIGQRQVGDGDEIGIIELDERPIALARCGWGKVSSPRRIGWTDDRKALVDPEAEVTCAGQPNRFA